MPRKPQEYAPPDLAKCSYTALYRIGILAILEPLFAGFGNCGSALRRLSTATANAKTQPPLKRVKGLPKGRVYFQLTSAGCRWLGVSPALAAPLGKAALDLAIAIAFLCAFCLRECHRVTHSELVPHLGNDTPPENVAHIIAAPLTDGSSPTLFRVYHATADVHSAALHVARLIENSREKPVLRKWIAAGQYGIAVLCPTKTAVEVMKRSLAASNLHGVAILVELGPTADTLDEALRSRRL